MVVITKNEKETMALGEKIAKDSKEGSVYCLTGDLGAGKTVFAKGFAKGLLIEDEITSPTFTIINEYEGVLPLYHFDCYRLSSAGDASCFDFFEYFDAKGVCLIEWGENIKSILPLNAQTISIERMPDDTRKIIYDTGN